MANIATTIGLLIREYNLQNIKVPDVRSNPYLNRGLEVAPDQDPTLYLSALGTPVVADLTLKDGSYIDNITGKLVTFPELKFDAVIMTVDFAAKIVKTEIQGRNGTVKEYIGEDDAKITIQGIICGTNGHYPAFEVGQLNSWRKAPVAKTAVSAFLQNLGIDNIVVESCSLPQVAGGYSYQTFTIQCISDLPVELKITTNV